jgi:hypothetical protein
VAEPLGVFQGELPVRADLRRPFLLVAVLLAQHGRADRPENVVPWGGAALAVRPEPAQHAQAHQHSQPVPGGREIAEPQRGELFGGQHAVPSYETGQLTVAVGQVSGHGEPSSLVTSC